MPKLIRLYIRQVLIGFALSAVFVGLVLWFNIANLWHLVTHSPGGALAVLMFWLFNGIVFAGVQFGIAIMRMGGDDDRDGGGKRDAIPADPVPVPVEAGARTRRVLGRRV
ncbi:hypothetical protein KUH32_11525 [Thalassococcus sp. CAU 1522]|uniref:Uncharacterized protein n=1 Tax=Thalassococcus arenae TaxID=2851652 RepID=A0ABS6N8U6_9RHOB|nr:hypothetical protein [Thalassococcus arenae]MBV2360408.1 hypothetical protein [Thalassococcus arenae]